MSMRWYLSNRGDTIAASQLADHHYNRQKPGSKQFTPPGRVIVLTTRNYDALWCTSYPYAQYVHHAWAGAWVNSLFRNENPYRQRTGTGNLSSELIREAIAATLWMSYKLASWQPGGAPPLGMITFINQEKVKPKAHYGACYRHAGFMEVGYTKSDGLLALQLVPERMPDPVQPHLTWLEETSSSSSKSGTQLAKGA